MLSERNSDAIIKREPPNTSSNSTVGLTTFCHGLRQCLVCDGEKLDEESDRNFRIPPQHGALCIITMYHYHVYSRKLK